MPNKKPLPTIVVFAIFTTITTFVWIAFDVYRAFTKDSSPSVPEEVIRALDPTIDPDVLSRAGERVYLEEVQIGQTEIALPPEPTEESIEIIDESLENEPEDLEETENEIEDEEAEELTEETDTQEAVEE